MTDPTPCRCCGRRIRKRPRRSKQHYRHKCRHGQWCIAGEPRQVNNAPRCAQCADALRTAEPDPVPEPEPVSADGERWHVIDTRDGSRTDLGKPLPYAGAVHVANHANAIEGRERWTIAPASRADATAEHYAAAEALRGAIAAQRRARADLAAADAARRDACARCDAADVLTDGDGCPVTFADPTEQARTATAPPRKPEGPA